MRNKPTLRERIADILFSRSLKDQKGELVPTFETTDEILKLTKEELLEGLKCPIEPNPNACGAEDDTDNCYVNGWEDAIREIKEKLK